MDTIQAGQEGHTTVSLQPRSLEDATYLPRWGDWLGHVRLGWWMHGQRVIPHEIVLRVSLYTCMW